MILLFNYLIKHLKFLIIAIIKKFGAQNYLGVQLYQNRLLIIYSKKWFDIAK